MILKGILMFFIPVIINYHENLRRVPVSINIFLKKHLILIEKRVFQQFGMHIWTKCPPPNYIIAEIFIKGCA
jgi:hypothetical protein